MKEGKSRDGDERDAVRRRSSRGRRSHGSRGEKRLRLPGNVGPGGHPVSRRRVENRRVKTGGGSKDVIFGKTDDRNERRSQEKRAQDRVRQERGAGEATWGREWGRIKLT